jgi:peptide/nickel transport system permease protein
MAFLIRRLAFYFVAVFVAITFNFIMPRLMPGDPVDALFAAAGGRMPIETLEAYREMLGFVDGPIWVQYLQYLKSVVTFDLGPAIMLFPVPVTEVLGNTLPWTIFLAGFATLFSIGIGCFIGLYASFNRGGLVDRFVPFIWAFIASMPQAVTCFLCLRAHAQMVSLGLWRQPRPRSGLDLRIYRQCPAPRHSADGHAACIDGGDMDLHHAQRDGERSW